MTFPTEHSKHMTPSLLEFYESELKSKSNAYIKRGQWPTKDSLVQEIWENLGLRGYHIPQEIDQITENYLRALFYPDWLKDLIENRSFREIIVKSNGYALIDHIQGSQIIAINQSMESIQSWMECVGVKIGVSWNLTTPFNSKSSPILGIPIRFSFLHEFVSSQKISTLSLRSISNNVIPLENFSNCQETRDFLSLAFSQKKSILIAGSTGSGKTSLLSTLLSLTPTNEHLVIMEDAEEISASGPMVTRMLTREGLDKYNLLHFQSYSLRLRPDRLCLGELRSSEAIQFVLSLNNGIKGLMSTIHCHCAAQAVERLALLVCLYRQGEDLDRSYVLEMISQSLDYIVFLEDRKIHEIIKPLNWENGRLYYERVYRLT